MPFAVLYNPPNVIFKSERHFSAFVVYAVHTVFSMFSPVNILVDIYFPPQPQTSLEIGWSQWHDCGYRWKIVTSDSLTVKWHIYLCLLHTVNWKFHEREGVSSISRPS